MKKTVLTLIGLAMIFQLAQCSSSSKKQEPVATDPAVEACTKDCTAAYTKCMQSAGKNESKKSVCSSNIVKCTPKCETKAKGYKKPAPEKKSTYSEL